MKNIRNQVWKLPNENVYLITKPPHKICKQGPHFSVTYFMFIPSSFYPSSVAKFVSFNNLPINLLYFFHSQAYILWLPEYISPFFREEKIRSGFIGEANHNMPLTCAIPLLTHTGVLGCWVSPLARCTPP